MTKAEQIYALMVEGHLGTKKGDHGMLPIDHPAIDKLSNPIYYIKKYKSELYALVTLPKSKSETCKADAIRLSQNLAYMLVQHRVGFPDCTFKMLK